MTEKQFNRRLISWLLKLYPKALANRIETTTMSGFPDHVWIFERRVLFVEAKMETRELRAAQNVWYHRFLETFETKAWSTWSTVDYMLVSAYPRSKRMVVRSPSFDSPLENLALSKEGLRDALFAIFPELPFHDD